MRLARILAGMVVISALSAMGCSAASKASFNKAMTGSTTGVPPTPGVSSGGGVEGATMTVATDAATVSQATVGTPIAGYASIIAGIAGMLLVAEKLAVAAGFNLPNSNGSQLASNSASAGGTNSPTVQPSPSNILKAA